MGRQIKANNVKAPREWGIAIHLTDTCGAIGIGIHQWLSGIVQDVHNTTSGASTVAWFLTWFWNFPRISNHQNQSVVNAFQYVCFSSPDILPSRKWRQETMQRYGFYSRFPNKSREKPGQPLLNFASSPTFAIFGGKNDSSRSHKFVTYPYQALEESVTNSLYHRDYREWEPVVITVEPQSITIQNVGGPDEPFLE